MLSSHSPSVLALIFICWIFIFIKLCTLSTQGKWTTILAANLSLHFSFSYKHLGIIKIVWRFRQVLIFKYSTPHLHIHEQTSDPIMKLKSIMNNISIAFFVSLSGELYVFYSEATGTHISEHVHYHHHFSALEG